ncbi:MAG: hypothetical protein LBE16_02545 [Clostridiales Family XIII bacterium]|jgi:hypothetical protein|nr:hypothetical protein [Clostridiales Family XIII bacterium]
MKPNRIAHMRIRILLAALLALCVLSSGCAKSEASESADAHTDGNEAAAPDTAERSEAARDVTPFSFSYKDTPIVPGEDMSDLLDAIGAPNDVFEAQSCAFDGVDRIYYYPGFLINTYPDRGKDKILSVSFRDDSVQTDEGLYLGMRADAVSSVYENGTRNAGGNALLFQNRDLELRVLFENDVAIDITLYYAPAQAQAAMAE